MDLKLFNSFYKEGYKLALGNAKSLNTVADISATKNEFGIACSLNILAAEEAIKAVVILTKHYHPQMDAKEFSDTFTSHKSKHSLIQVLTILWKISINMLYDKYQEQKYYFDIVETFPEEEAKKFKEKHKYLYKVVGWVKRQKPAIDIFDEALKWWTQANLQKNRGLYVDIVDKKWHNPRSFTKQKYEQERKYTETLIEYIEAFNTMFSPIKIIRELKTEAKKNITISGA
ncbi:MAG: AbiV family abortive infection protein [Agriterribacter sp.]